MGRNRVVVAVLLEHSVNVATSRESRIEMAKGGIFCRGTKLAPSHLDKPDTCKPQVRLQTPNWDCEKIYGNLKTWLPVAYSALTVIRSLRMSMDRFKKQYCLWINCLLYPAKFGLWASMTYNLQVKSKSTVKIVLLNQNSPGKYHNPLFLLILYVNLSFGE